MAFHPRAHVLDQRAEQFIFRIEIGVETAQRGPRPLGDAGDRGFVETLFTKFQRGCIQQFAFRPQPPRSARLLAIGLGMFGIFSGHNVTANRI